MKGTGTRRADGEGRNGARQESAPVERGGRDRGGDAGADETLEPLAFGAEM
jgi:hypothetical protein